MIETCKHCGAPLAGTTGDRCLSCGARMDAMRSSMLPSITPASEPHVDPPPGNVTQAGYIPLLLPAQLSPASAPTPTPPARKSKRRLWIILGVVGALLLAVCGGCGDILYWAISSQLAPKQAGETVLFQDSLLDSTGAWPFQENHCGYVSTGYLVNGASCIANAGPFDDLDISVTVHQINGSVAGFYGVMFRQHDGQNAYIFDISTDGS
jgi:hypothetical protein